MVVEPFVERIDEQLKLIGDEHESDEIEADAENLFDLVIMEKARLALLSSSLFPLVLLFDEEEAVDVNEDLKAIFLPLKFWR